jgi:hypothetical protein
MRILRAAAVMWIFVLSVRAADLQPASRAETFARDLTQQPVARYQAGSVFSRDSSLTKIWIDDAIRTKTILEQHLSLPDTFRVLISDVAVSYDGTIAASASATNREGQSVAVIAWLRPDGTLLRVVPTTPFGARKISFTADGSLWAGGMVKSDETLRDEAPVHDVLRRYDSEGLLVATFLPRESFLSEWPHPARYALLVTSRDRVAFVSDSAKKWAVLAADGTLLGQGTLESPENFQTMVGAITDSGRLFLSGQWRGNPPAGGSYPPIPLFEVNQTNGKLEQVDTPEVSREGRLGHLLGSEGEQLVFHVESTAGRQIVWRNVD